MKNILLMFMFIFSPFASAERITASVYTYAMADGLKCDYGKIPVAAKAAIDEGLQLVVKACERPNVLNIRILSVEPRICHSLTAGYEAVAEIEYECGR